MRSFTVKWRTTETHETTVTAEDLADMLRVGLDEVEAASVDQITDLGDRGLENGLSDIEGGDTYDGCVTREIESVSLVRTADAADR